MLQYIIYLIPIFTIKFILKIYYDLSDSEYIKKKNYKREKYFIVKIG